MWLLAAGLSGAIAGFFATARVDRSGPLARPEFDQLTNLPLVAYPVLLLGLAAIVLASRVWWLGLVLFFGWLPVEDLVRKFANNDLRIYFVKDFLLLVLLLSMGGRLAGCWRRPLGSVWFATIGVFAFAAVYSLPSALQSPSIPIVGIHGRFLFALAFPVGAYIAQDRERLRRTIYGLGITATAVCALGIVQSVVGPEFLNPNIEASSFEHLVVTKRLGEAEVVRPAGPFADVSRYASMTIVSTTLTAAALRLARDRAQMRLAAAGIAVSLAGAFASGSRTAILIAPMIAAVGAISSARVTRRQLVRGLAAIGAVLVVATVVIGGNAAAQSLSRVTLYVRTLNPTASAFELGSRVSDYANNASAGVRFGGFLGNGTGVEAIGKRYLNVEETASQVESGWGSVASEWGYLGLAAWVTWSLLWSKRSIEAVRAVGPGGAIAPVVAAYVVSLLLIMFSLGSGFLDNYIANIYFWFLSGAAFASSGFDVSRKELGFDG